MYNPSHFTEADDTVITDLVRSTGFGHLVCHGDEGLTSIPIPFVVDQDLRSVRAHVARANPIWKAAAGPALLIVPISDHYVSPGWYPSKAEHGRVVPTWNYEIVHLHGTIVVQDDPNWIRDQIAELTRTNEAPFPEPWAVSDAPSDFIEKQIRAIVGIEFSATRIEAKRKLSQNRSTVDRAGVVHGLRSQTSSGGAIADAMDPVDS